MRGDTGGKPILLKYPKQIKTLPVRSEGVIKDIEHKGSIPAGVKDEKGLR